ncbi:class I SAM-dependent methyltransferase [Herbivorax sp. ANBcel31]|uniref:class I SAM-dependent methyltransferase n=1 Tax=Herbivorax sp. ANBcel31 TaxID=3069754 RepID=UPI0027B61B6E|nr:class I SAM-dependent methyltransferase [Herbivorax sp. ANBcel31]MDQ2086323.1 class I SAM-dependent methyltransferase [Herbivorax sp. ANBcel31]
MTICQGNPSAHNIYLIGVFMENINIEIQRFYNDIAQKFADEWYSNEDLLPTLKNFIDLLNPNPRILDMGCGAGYESMRLYKLGARVTGIDFSDEPIRIARKRNPQCQFEIMDFRKLDESFGVFDGIVAIASIIHIEDEELNLVFGNMKKVIRPEGYVMIVVVEGNGIWEESSKIELEGVQYNRPFYLHNKLRLNEVAEDNGFVYFDELKLSEEQASFGWKCLLFKDKR